MIQVSQNYDGPLSHRGVLSHEVTFGLTGYRWPYLLLQLHYRFVLKFGKAKETFTHKAKEASLHLKFKKIKTYILTVDVFLFVYQTVDKVAVAWFSRISFLTNRSTFTFVTLGPCFPLPCIHQLTAIKWTLFPFQLHSYLLVTTGTAHMHWQQYKKQ